MRIFYLLILYLLIAFDIPAQWTNKNPVPDNNNLKNVFFINNNIGWIVGSDGYIVKTTNGGLNWVQQNGGTNYYLTRVRFVDENNGWVVGESGIILKTTNGGDTWIDQNIGTAGNLLDVKFISNTTGWIVGWEGTILKTTDGGNTWIFQNTLNNYDLFSIDFIDDSVGVSVGVTNADVSPTETDSSIILKTTNGGLTWIKKGEDLPQAITGWTMGFLTVDFIDDSTAFAGGGWYGSGNGYALAKSTDGGENWFWSQSTLFSKNFKKNNTLLDFGYAGIQDIYFKDTENGYLTIGCNEYGTEIKITADGGENWVNKYYNPEWYDLYSVFVTSSGKGWAVGQAGQMFTTEDNGTTWSQQLSGYGVDDVINNIFMLNDNIGWAIGGGSDFSGGHHFIFKTTNSGKTWNAQLYASGSTFRTVFFLDPSTGWVDNYRTTDGGQTWNTISYGGQRLFFINQNIGWATGGNGYSDGIRKTTDGGVTWVDKSSVNIVDVYFSDINHGWAVGPNGSILKSTDAGETWTPKTSGSTINLKSVKFLDSNIGVCAGEGELLLTNDGGDTWIIKTAPVFQTINIYNIKTFLGYTSHGALYKTINGGDSWNMLDTGIGTGQTAFFTSEYTGWIGGINGTMYKYSVDHVLPAEWLGQITIADAGGTEASQVLSFGQHINPTDGIDAPLGEYELPPPPISGVFDARFNLPTNPVVSSLTDFRDRTETDITWTITFQPGSSGYPMTLSWDSTGFPEGTFYLKGSANGRLVRVNMKNQRNYVVADPAITSLRIEYRRNFPSVSVNESGRITDKLPVSYELSQNYPNPFNPVTTIKFTLPEMEMVNLSIYNILGELVSTPINQVLKPGYHEINFNASSLASGIYIYSIHAGNYNKTKKMVLLR